MSGLKELVAIATKVAVDGALKGKEVLKDFVTSSAAVSAGGAADEAAKKLNLYRTNRWGEQVLKIPFFKTTDDKIEEALAKHPERDKVVFHFTDSLLSIRDGVVFYGPDGNEVFHIPANKNNLRQIELYQGEKYIGRIEKHVTINLNPLSNLQKYDLQLRNSKETVRVELFTASIERASWTMTRKSEDFCIMNKNGAEFARFYNLGFYNYVFDYDSSADPAALIFAFIAMHMRIQEHRNNHPRHGYKGKGPILEDMIGNIKDIF